MVFFCFRLLLCYVLHEKSCLGSPKRPSQHHDLQGGKFFFYFQLFFYEKINCLFFLLLFKTRITSLINYLSLYYKKNKYLFMQLFIM